MSTLRELEFERTSPRLLEVLRRQGLARLTEFQTKSLKKGIMRGTSQILVTNDYVEGYQIGEIALLNRVASDFRTRGIVLCPHPHQAEKRLRSVAQKCSRMGIEITPIIRRSDAIDLPRDIGRVVVATFRSLSIAARKQPSLWEDVSFLLIERLDLIGQPKLGVQLETAIVGGMGRISNIQYVALCPEVADLPDLAKWLDASIVRDKKPDVNRIFSVKVFKSITESLADLSQYVHKKQGQVIILAPDIQSSQILAERLTGLDDSGTTPHLDFGLTPGHRDELRELCMRIKRVHPQCNMTQRLVNVLSKGVAFFHEGVAKKQRRAISEAWEDKLVPVIVMPTRFALASGMTATVVFLIGVFAHRKEDILRDDEELVMLSEWQMNNLLQAAGRAKLDTEGFGILVVDNEQERERVLLKYFRRDEEGNLMPRLGEVDSLMDNPENLQFLVLGQLCTTDEQHSSPLAIINETFWASTNKTFNPKEERYVPIDEISIDTLLSLRATKSTLERAEEIGDEDVKVVSVSPSKIEGLVHSASRELWHYVTLNSSEGVSCSCESWKYQGMKNHRLCKHLVKFANYALHDDEAEPYTNGVLRHSLRGLETLDELEQSGLLEKSSGEVRCTELGRRAAALGVSIGDARRTKGMIEDSEGDFTNTLIELVQTKTGANPEQLKRILTAVLEDDNQEGMYCEDDYPGLIENHVEELLYVNSVLEQMLIEDENGILKERPAHFGEKLRRALSDIG
ncbi:MAG: hypothetical protein KGY80_04930 [Candidatus Thorarchaeota archaeon]|nr:hypothetical protein [Candidatus Thorarchaeota archaeon]